jgi:hypothetical protein
MDRWTTSRNDPRQRAWDRQLAATDCPWGSVAASGMSWLQASHGLAGKIDNLVRSGNGAFELSPPISPQSSCGGEYTAVGWA